MSDFAIKADRFVLPGVLRGAGYLSVHDGTFGAWTAEAPAGYEIVDRTGSWVAPGYVDTHIHGFVDRDVMDCDPDGIDEASLALAKKGTTSWVPTTLTQPAGQIESACASVSEAAERRGEDFPGARIEGIYLEGPFFTAEHAGAQNPDNMCDPSVELLCSWQEAAHGLICKSAIAPERAGSERYCASLKAMGVAVALGHSSATCEEGLAAVAAGASLFVHVYNGMSGHHHREPGLVTAAMISRGTYAELICDGMHVTPAAIDALVRAKGWEHVCVISDCLRCGGMPDGDYTLGDFPVRLQGGIARLVQKDGSLGNIAGSSATLAQEVRNLVEWGIVTPEQAIRMATEVPARSAGIDDVCGQMLPGRAADFNVLTQDLSVQETYLDGRLVR
ncbi:MULTISPECIES: N-acetylglucosamine-6-phosphate deacetylase [Atopobiaceae]|uniref:N-acetylglucosamine 6-phosphate deacetylase n=1 Tax=Parafannyhessea umbonata TaxID=604330 RepID=A0A1H9N5Z1_9ACTN|nr:MULTISPECIES: N-acetylglucosamine-6-phosphate deacetylase [Atopobiaceae]SEH37859.1 N-acetylglucosamine 6-phosphate deacetylase [Parafannyhessea umbonata]SER31089.1 N-acetylglucosamine 6-phosphate deacetylase [Parafannyhessea umbonata]SJZ40436.1 N-acetylglucosamine-6-phosphate deacetylase [Olsenella sp. KH1P3]